MGNFFQLPSRLIGARQAQPRLAQPDWFCLGVARLTAFCWTWPAENRKYRKDGRKNERKGGRKWEKDGRMNGRRKGRMDGRKAYMSDGKKEGGKKGLTVAGRQEERKRRREGGRKEGKRRLENRLVRF